MARSYEDPWLRTLWQPAKYHSTNTSIKEKIISEKQKGKLILITSHLLSELDDMISGLIYMQEGIILLQNTTAEVQARTGEMKISKAISHILKTMNNE